MEITNQNMNNKISLQNTIMTLIAGIASPSVHIISEVIFYLNQYFNEETLNDNAKQMLNFCFSHNIEINNFSFNYKAQYQYTLRNN